MTHAKLDSLQISGFGPVEHADISLEPLTVLVGPNDVGKTMVLRALASIGAACRAEAGWASIFTSAAHFRALSHNNRDERMQFRLAGTVADGEPFEYDVAIRAHERNLIENESIKMGTQIVSRTGPNTSYGNVAEEMVEQVGLGRSDLPFPHASWRESDPRHILEYTRFQDALRRTQPALALIANQRMFALRPDALRATSAEPDTASRRGMRPDGRGLPGAVFDLLLRNRDLLHSMEEMLATAIPRFKRIDIDYRADGVALEFVMHQGLRVPSTLTSDGLLLFLAYVYLALGPSNHSILLIEEPEFGLHPGLLRRLVDLFRTIAHNDSDGAQIILTTHSPILLDSFHPHEIRVVTRDEAGLTHVTPFENAPDLRRLLEYMGPGEVWANLGEDKIAGGT